MKADCCCLCWHEIKKYLMQCNCSDSTRIFKCDCKKLWIMNKQKTSHSTTNKKIPISRTILVHHKFKLQTKLKVKSMKLRYSLGIYSLFFFWKLLYVIKMETGKLRNVCIYFDFEMNCEHHSQTWNTNMCLIDASSRVATNHHDDLDLFTFLFSNRMLLDK